MKLSRLYSNDHRFEQIDFGAGVNVVFAEIRLPENQKKDTHNLGKTTLGRLIDFCLLAKRKSTFFLFKQAPIFDSFVFFLELELLDGTFLTVRRSVKDASKVSFKKHLASKQNYCSLPEQDWDHYKLPFKRAVTLLDSFLNWRVGKTWPFRKGLGYHLRSQDDFRDVFQLARFKGQHKDWKPYLANLLGFDADLITSFYERKEELERVKTKIDEISRDLTGNERSSATINGILVLKRDELQQQQELLDSFDFRQRDLSELQILVDKLDEEISALNEVRYSFAHREKKIRQSLEEDKLLFCVEDAERIFHEAGVLFVGQIKRDFNQLVTFNREITDERHMYLREELDDTLKRIDEVKVRLDELGKQRSQSLAFLSDTNVFDKYKLVSDELVTLKADIAMLEQQKSFLSKIEKLNMQKKQLAEEVAEAFEAIGAELERQTSNKDSCYSKVLLSFSQIVEDVIDRKALINVRQNKEGNLDFSADILDQSGNATSADDGHTYRKLLCIAFDLAVLKVFSKEHFPKFVFHDGVFESLDDRKKKNLLNVIRTYADSGLQIIITLINSDLPVGSSLLSLFRSDEIVLKLHDEGEDGLLFKMKTW